MAKKAVELIVTKTMILEINATRKGVVFVRRLIHKFDQNCA